MNEEKNEKVLLGDENKEDIMSKEIHSIFAKPRIVLVGDMKFKVRTVPMGEMDEVTKLLSKYNEALKKNGFDINKEVSGLMAEIIYIGIHYYHPNWTKEKIMSYIPYEYFPDFIKEITGNENFQKKMMAMMGAGISLNQTS